ncbi:MAG: heat-inducible transcription repressor HrcA [Oscillospiraceae bacterium]|nr:heat-inducible transcription repressor HrcA [Oscillospiraceae bacterium]
MELSQRKELILSSIVEFYIETGQPVGSKFLVTALPFTVSSATIRNEMAELSEMGYLEQPHTSAGRIPSDRGLRYYADKLLKVYSPSQSEMLRISGGIDHFEGDAELILNETCEILSELTSSLVLATTPFLPDAVINNIQLLPMGKRSALVVFSTSAGIFKSRIAKLQSDADYSLFELFYNVCAANFIGSTLSDITRASVQSVAASLGERALDLSPLIVSLFDAITDSSRSELIMKGYDKLLSSSLRVDAPGILELIGNREIAYRLLKENVSGNIKLKIGSENGFSALRNASIIICPYKAGESEAGVLAAIVPTKADYQHIVPLVKYAGDMATELISGNIN